MQHTAQVPGVTAMLNLPQNYTAHLCTNTTQSRVAKSIGMELECVQKGMKSTGAEDRGYKCANICTMRKLKKLWQ